jgi:hypothetical protein
MKVTTNILEGILRNKIVFKGDKRNILDRTVRTIV